MDVDIHWEKRESALLRINCSGQWNWADLDRASTVWKAARSAPPENLCVLVDLRRVTMPIDVVLHLRTAANLARESNALVVVLATSAAMLLVFKTFVAMYKAIGDKFHIAADEAEAYAILGLPTA